MQSTIPEIIEDHLEEDLDDFDPPFSPQSPEETITTSNSKPNLSISTSKPPPTSATMARHLLEGGAGRKKSKLEVSRSSSNFDTNLTTPLSTMVEHSFIPNPVAVQQAAEELEEKQKRKISGGTPVLGQATLTPFPTDNIIITPTPNVNIAIPITPSVQVLPHSEDTFTSNLEDLHYEDDASMLEQIKAKEACFAEEYISEEIVQVCRDLYKVLDMRRKHQVGEYTDDEKKEYRPWNCFYSKDDFIGIVDEDDLLLHSRGQQNVGSTIHAPFDPNDIEACKRIPSTNEDFIECRKGVFFVKNAAGREFVPPVSFEEHFRDYRFLSNIMYDAPTKSFCYTRLTALELKFTLFKKLKQFEEVKTQKMVPHRDWYNVRKVDGHLHLSSMANQKHLLRFIKTKLKQCPDEVVIVRDGKKLTLSEVFKSLHMTPYDLSVDTLDVHVDKSQTMHRFDKFNLKYSPFGQSRLREIFLKTDNLIEGKYFAEMNKEVFRDLEDSRYQHAEPRVSIYGKQKDEWTSLANWICKFKMFSTNIRWLIQIPRLYNIHKEFKSITNFEQMLKNIFEPLFEATRSPEKYPELSTFLGIIVGFDSVDDESKPEPRFHLDLPSPDEWTNDENPPYAYYTYYFYANLKVLNAYRKSKGMNTFAIRPHAGEAGSASHLVSAYLLSDEINHGIELRKAPVLQYLYYLSQIGLAMSPLSNNSLFLSYEKNPFPQFFQRGLNVTLSTDDPLMFHFTREPLMEEYSIAAQVYHLSNVDLCEIARNSVIQSGFEDVYKKYWLGTTRLFGRNDIRQSNVPNLRLKYRFETLFDEHLFIQKALAVDYLKKKVKGVKYAIPPPMPPTEVLAHLLRDKPSYLALSFGSMGSLNNYPALTMTTPKNTEPPVSEASVIATKAKEERAKHGVEGGAYNIWILSAAILIGSVIIGHSLKK